MDFVLECFGGGAAEAARARADAALAADEAKSAAPPPPPPRLGVRREGLLGALSSLHTRLTKSLALLMCVHVWLVPL
jgi:hypothetical protein